MMQLITGANTIDISVTENSTIANPEFVFVFINDNTGKKVACLLPLKDDRLSKKPDE